MDMCLILIHVLKFALDGMDYEQLEVAGDIFDILSRVRKISHKHLLIKTICYQI